MTNENNPSTERAQILLSLSKDMFAKGRPISSFFFNEAARLAAHTPADLNDIFDGLLEAAINLAAQGMASCGEDVSPMGDDFRRAATVLDGVYDHLTKGTPLPDSEIPRRAETSPPHTLSGKVH